MTSSSPPRNIDTPTTHATRDSVKTLTTAVNSRAPRHRPPRSLPPWIDSYDEKYGTASEDQFRLLNPPTRAVQPQHNSSPSDPQRRVSVDGFVELDDPLQGQAKGNRKRIPHVLRYGRASMRGRKWDHLRSAEPVIISGFKPLVKSNEPSVAWQDFVQSSAYGHATHENSAVVDYTVMEKLQPNFANPALEPYSILDSRTPRRKRALAPYKRVWIMMVRHSLAPLLFRLSVMVTSIVALGIAAKINRIEEVDSDDTAEEAQSIVAVSVDCVAIPYLAYMIWDEYTGKPLGLRSAVSKISLMLLDLFFIIFKSASTALAFESLVYHNLEHVAVRDLSKALAAFMVIGLILWTLNFAVNIFRTVERLGGGEEE